jgi:transcriptional regulator with XRE-family HTH domain
MGQSTVAVRILHPSMVFCEQEGAFDVRGVPPRSRLYGLTPCKVGTIWTESLTSYLNRLGWRHGVSPRTLVIQELLPHLNPEHLPLNWKSFYRQAALNLNGSSDFALEWSTLLERLTSRSDLHFLTLLWWIGNLAPDGHFKKTPSWCSVCYAEWKENQLPIYQPLLWQYQVVTLCPQHKRRLDERCPSCHKAQSVISAKIAQPGECTQCGVWLGTKADDQSEPMNDDDIFWQQWVIHALEELLLANFSAGPLQWEQFFTGLAICLQEPGAYSRLARLTGISRSLFYQWPIKPATPSSYVPSLETLLELCFACNVTPLQILSHHLTGLQAAIQKGTLSQPVRPRRPISNRLDHDRCLQLLKDILEGKEEPLSLCQIAKRQGCIVRTLLTHFPHECTLISKLAREHRKQRQEQRLKQVHDQVRQSMIALHSQEIFPASHRLRALLPPGFMGMPEARAAWRATLRELGLES